MALIDLRARARACVVNQRAHGTGQKLLRYTGVILFRKVPVCFQILQASVRSRTIPLARSCKNEHECSVGTLFRHSSRNLSEAYFGTIQF